MGRDKRTKGPQSVSREEGVDLPQVLQHQGASKQQADRVRDVLAGDVHASVP